MYRNAFSDYIELFCTDNGFFMAFVKICISNKVFLDVLVLGPHGLVASALSSVPLLRIRGASSIPVLPWLMTIFFLFCRSFVATAAS